MVSMIETLGDITAASLSTMLGVADSQRAHGTLGGRIAGRLGDNRYVADRARNGRSKCHERTCREFLCKGAPRIGKMPPSLRHTMKTKWFHIECCFKSFDRVCYNTKTITSASEIEGIDEAFSPAEIEVVEQGVEKHKDTFAARVENRLSCHSHHAISSRSNTLPAYSSSSSSAHVANNHIVRPVSPTSSGASSSSEYSVEMSSSSGDDDHSVGEDAEPSALELALYSTTQEWITGVSWVMGYAQEAADKPRCSPKKRRRVVRPVSPTSSDASSSEYSVEMSSRGDGDYSIGKDAEPSALELDLYSTTQEWITEASWVDLMGYAQEAADEPRSPKKRRRGD
jgi:hypothetical protein